MLVSIIIPAYKQEKTIKADVENIWNAMDQTRWDFEVIVVVDGFVDKTLQEAKKFKRPNVQVVGYETNRGKGYAVRFGMARAKGDYIAFIDSGMDINANGISMLLEHMEWYNADAMVGSKRHLASKVKYPFFRKVYSFGYQTLVKLFFGLKITDTQTGLKVFKRKVLEKVLPRLAVKKFAFDIELLAVSHHLGFTKIYESPVEVAIDFTKSSFKQAGLFLFDPQVRDMFYDTLGVFYRMYFLKYYDDDSKRKWTYDKELEMRVNTGEME